MGSFIGKIAGILQTIKRRINQDPFERSVDAFVYALEKKANQMLKVGKIHHANRARLAAQLIKDGFNFKYVDDIEEMYERNYGKPSVTELDDEDTISVLLWWPNAFDSEHNEQINENYEEDMLIAVHKSHKSQDLGWKIVQYNFREWTTF